MGKTKRSVFKTIGVFLQYLFLELIALIYYSIKGIVRGPIFGKVGIIGAYAGVIFLAVFKRIFFWGIIVLALFVGILLAISETKDFLKYEDNKKEKKRKRNKENSVFEGMSISEAEKEYKKLLKEYHPDKETGDLKKIQTLTVAYTEYCNKYR